jgi:hypothetical protein
MLLVRDGLWTTRSGVVQGTGGNPLWGLSQRLVGGWGQPALGLSASVHMSRQARQAGSHAACVVTAHALASHNFASRCLIHLDMFRYCALSERQPDAGL